MPFTEFELENFKPILSEYVEKIRPDPSIRDKLDIGYRINGFSIEIIEIRPHFLNEEEIEEIPVAKTKFIKKQGIWKIYWIRADQKWHRYEPNPEVQSLNDFIEVVEKDEWQCFWG